MKAAVLAIVVVVCAVLASLASASVHEEQGLKCSMCQFVIKEVEKVAENNLTQAGLAKAITGICNQAHIGAWCQQNVIPIIGEILAAIVNKVDPVKVCGKIKLCKANSTDAEKILAAIESDVAVSNLHEMVEMGSIGCSVCEAIIEYVQKNLIGPAQAAKIQQLVTAACAKIPFAQNTCVKFIAPTIAKITVLIGQHLSPEQVCTSITFCSS
jgi:saposin